MKHTLILWSKLSFVFYNIVLYGLKIIGLAPFSVRRRNAWGNNAQRSDLIQPFKHSKVGSVYNVALLIPILARISISFIVTADSKDESISDYANKAILLLRNIVELGSTGLVLVWWNLRQKKAVATLNLLFEVNVRLSELKQQSSEKWMVVTFFIHLCITTVVWTSFAILVVDYTSFISFVMSVLYNSPYIISFWFTLEYSVIVNFVVRRLDTVNELLTNYQGMDSRPSSHPSVRNHAWMITDYNKRVALIRSLCSTRSTLIELCHNIADFFSLPILMVILYSFVGFFNDAYYTFMKGYNQVTEHNVIYENGSTLHWCVLILGVHIYPVTSLTLSVTRANQQIQMTGRILNKLLFTLRSGSAVQLELMQFSRNLLHDSVDVFTAYGLFSLDSTLLPSMLASTATYFIVLLQFRPPDVEPRPFCNCTISP